MLATCRTVDCENEGIALEVGDLVYTDDETGETYPMKAICGVCGDEITDITESPANE